MVIGDRDYDLSKRLNQVRKRLDQLYLTLHSFTSYLNAEVHRTTTLLPLLASSCDFHISHQGSDASVARGAVVSPQFALVFATGMNGASTRYLIPSRKVVGVTLVVSRKSPINCEIAQRSMISWYLVHSLPTVRGVLLTGSPGYQLGAAEGP